MDHQKLHNDREIWTELISVGGDRLEHELWITAIRCVALSILAQRRKLRGDTNENDDDDDEEQEDDDTEDSLIQEWVNDSLPSNSILAWVLGDVGNEYFGDMGIEWHEYISFGGDACNLQKKEILDHLRDRLENYPDAVDAITKERLEDYFNEWCTLILRRVLSEAKQLKPQAR